MGGTAGRFRAGDGRPRPYRTRRRRGAGAGNPRRRRLGPRGRPRHLMSWPRRIALGLLVALPVLLVAALWFGPRLTDWNTHRDRLAILAAGRLGQPVMLTGPVK